MMCEVFILAPTDLVDDDEIARHGPASTADRRSRPPGGRA